MARRSALRHGGQPKLQMTNVPVRVLASSLVLLALGGAANAVDLALAPAAIEHALTISRADATARRDFHRPYILQVSDPLITSIEVITELRRMVLLAEERVGRGDVLFTRGTRRATAALEPWRGTLSVTVSVRVDPQRVFAVAAPVDLVLTGQSGDVLRRRQRSRTLYGDPGPGGRVPVIGAQVEADFMAMPLAQSPGTLIVSVGGRERRRLPIDFRSLR